MLEFLKKNQQTINIKMINTLRKCSIILIFVTCALAVDLQYSEIVTVNNETRYIVLNPDTALTLFSKNHYVGGQYVFTSGKRISGERHW